MPILIDPIGPIGDQAASVKDWLEVHGRQLVTLRKFDDQTAMTQSPAGSRSEPTAIRRLREARDAALDLAGLADIDRNDLHPE